jgi:hypothetical protein
MKVTLSIGAGLMILAACILLVVKFQSREDPPSEVASVQAGAAPSSPGLAPRRERRGWLLRLSFPPGWRPPGAGG